VFPYPKARQQLSDSSLIIDGEWKSIRSVQGVENAITSYPLSRTSCQLKQPTHAERTQTHYPNGSFNLITECLRRPTGSSVAVPGGNCGRSAL